MTITVLKRHHESENERIIISRPNPFPNVFNPHPIKENLYASNVHIATIIFAISPS